MKNVNGVLVLGGLLLAFGPSVGRAGILNLSTGLDSGGTAISTDLGCDAHWQVSGVAACAGGAAQTVRPGDGDWYSGWAANSASSEWITRNASVTTNGSPLPTFSISFNLTDTAGASLTGSWSSDDSSNLYLNGNLLASGAQWGLTALPIVNSGFVAGTNVLSFQMSSSDNYLEGVRFEGTVTGNGAAYGAASAAPEPGSWVLLLGGMTGLWFGRKSLRQQ